MLLNVQICDGLSSKSWWLVKLPNSFCLVLSCASLIGKICSWNFVKEASYQKLADSNTYNCTTCEISWKDKEKAGMFYLLQAYTSVRGTSPELKDNRDLAVLMNNVSFHSKLVDVPERLLMEVSDLSIFW